MKIDVEIQGILRRPHGVQREQLAVADAISASQLIALLGYSEREQRALRLVRAGKILEPGAMLADGDLVIVFAPVGGG
jgi:molybdopterin converting factor small subunit